MNKDLHPLELEYTLTYILSFLDGSDLKIARATSKKWNQAALTVWRHKFLLAAEKFEDAVCKSGSAGVNLRRKLITNLQFGIEGRKRDDPTGNWESFMKSIRLAKSVVGEEVREARLFYDTEPDNIASFVEAVNQDLLPNLDKLELFNICSFHSYYFPCFDPGSLRNLQSLSLSNVNAPFWPVGFNFRELCESFVAAAPNLKSLHIDLHKCLDVRSLNKLERLTLDRCGTHDAMVGKQMAADMITMLEGVKDSLSYLAFEH